MRGFLFGAVVAIGSVAAVGCTPDTQCEYPEAQPVTADFATELQGCWHGVGNVDVGQDPAFLVVYDFDAPTGDVNRWREIQPANRIFPNGSVFMYAYNVTEAQTVSDPETGETVAAARLELGWSGVDVPLPPQAIANINSTSLLLNFLTSDGALYAQQALRRAQCSGFGFEDLDPATACARAAATDRRRPIPWAN